MGKPFQSLNSHLTCFWLIGYKQEIKQKIQVIGTVPSCLVAVAAHSL